MAFSKVSEQELVGKAAELFRSRGYEGASLSDLAEATGLEKASLYHRFPGGKEEIAMAVAKQIGEWFEKNVLQPLHGEGKPAERVRHAAQRLREFYGEGKKFCVLDTLSLPGGGKALESALRGALAAWLDAFASVARDSGVPPKTARLRAEQAIVEVEGALVISRVTGDAQPFARAIARLSEILLGTGN